jgi:hypothetical protein
MGLTILRFFIKFLFFRIPLSTVIKQSAFTSIDDAMCNASLLPKPVSFILCAVSKIVEFLFTIL